jgi:uncharacterized membrane protein
VNWFVLFKLLHVLSVIWLMAGLLARPTILAAARRAPDVRVLKAIADVSGRLEERMIAPGIFAVLISGVATALSGGYSLFGPLSGGPWWIFIAVAVAVIAIVTTPMTLGRDRRWGQALEESAAAGVITDTLRPFLQRDAMVRRYAPDIVGALVIIVLMVTKPF